MVPVVEAAEALATGSVPTHLEKTCPDGAAFAVRLTVAPAEYLPVPVPLVTES